MTEILNTQGNFESFIKTLHLLKLKDTLMSTLSGSLCVLRVIFFQEFGSMDKSSKIHDSTTMFDSVMRIIFIRFVMMYG